MADKSIDQLNPAEKIYPTDRFVVQQSGQAKSVSGQVMINYLTEAADGHGGIQSIVKLSTSGLADTYRITLADTTTFDFVVTNGRSVNGISKTSTSGLVDTYTITYNNGTTSTFAVKNGEKGDKGDNAYVWIKYASQEPTELSHSIGDIPDNWIGIYAGNASAAPSDWKQYKWFQYKGDKGDTGDAATLVSKSVTYQVGDSGSIIPSGSWGSSVPVVPQGKYLWTKTEIQFNTGDPIVSYSVARMGMDGSGSVSSVNNVSPDENGNVSLTADNVGALPATGGGLTGELRMNGQPISGLNPPTENTQAATKGYVDTAVRKAAPRNLLDNSDFRNPVNQRGQTSYNEAAHYTIDRWLFDGSGSVSVSGDGLEIKPATYASIYQDIENSDLLTGKQMTLAAKTIEYGILVMNFVFGSAAALADSTASVQLIHWDGNRVYVRALEGTEKVTIQYVALYEGAYTAETLPEYHTNGYAAELLECQRYFWKLSDTDYIRAIPGIMTSATKARFMIPLPTKMRTTPTVTMNFNKFSIYPGGLQISNIAEVVLDGTFVLLGLTTSGGTTNAICILRCVGTIELSADL